VKPWALIPAKPFQDAKTRLMPVLDQDCRAALAEAMLARTIAVARAADPDMAIVIVSYPGMADTVAADLGADLLFLSMRSGLNEQLADAASSLSRAGPLLILHADLPFLETADVVAMLETEQQVVVAPDRAGSGTNALMLRGGRRIFRFGDDSFVQHCTAALSRASTVGSMRRFGLGFDLDGPKDWLDFLAMRGGENARPVATGPRDPSRLARLANEACS
jgi:2-phospho-L-lactate guanylyltransferase